MTSRTGKKPKTPSRYQMNQSLLDHYKGEDLISDVGMRVESLLDAEEARQHAFRCNSVRGFEIFYLGGILHVIRDREFYIDYGHDSFKNFLESELGIARSTAYDWIALYDGLIDSEVSWGRINHLGWTKIRLFAKCLTKDNWEDWVAIAEKHNAGRLREIVRQQIRDKAGFDGEDDKASSVSTHVDTTVSLEGKASELDRSEKAHKSRKQAGPSNLVTAQVASTAKQTLVFKLAADQAEVVTEALQIAMADAETEYSSAALTNICMHFLTTFEPQVCTQDHAVTALST